MDDYIDYATDIASNLSAIILAIVGIFLISIGSTDKFPAIILAAVGFPIFIPGLGTK